MTQPKSSVEYVVDQNGCWVWQRATNGRGYGQKWIAEARRQVYAHRWFYEQANGPIPAGMTIDHLCRNRSCVNPSHMRLLKRSEHGAHHAHDQKPRPRREPNHCVECGKVISRNGRRCKPHAAAHWQRRDATTPVL